MSKIDISIIIPCYNEAENLKKGVLEEVSQYFKTQNYNWEVIISDDESTDESWNLVEDFIKGKNNYIHLKNKHGGKPFAVRSGLEKARGEWVLFTDMDQATPINQLDKLKSNFNHFDIVIGSRGIKRKNFPLYRKIASFLFLSFRRLILLGDILDTQCGFKSFKKEVVIKIFPKLEVFRKNINAKGWRVSAYDVELLFLAEKSGFKIKEVPVMWEDRDAAKKKNRSFIKESLEMFKELIRVRLNDIKGLYDN